MADFDKVAKVVALISVYAFICSRNVRLAIKIYVPSMYFLYMLSATSLTFETDVIVTSNRTVKHTSWIRNKIESPWFCKCPFDCPPLNIFIPGSTSHKRFLTILVACNSKKNVLERFEVLMHIKMLQIRKLFFLKIKGIQCITVI